MAARNGCSLRIGRAGWQAGVLWATGVRRGGNLKVLRVAKSRDPNRTRQGPQKCGSSLQTTATLIQIRLLCDPKCGHFLHPPRQTSPRMAPHSTRTDVHNLDLKVEVV